MAPCRSWGLRGRHMGVCGHEPRWKTRCFRHFALSVSRICRWCPRGEKRGGRNQSTLNINFGSWWEKEQEDDYTGPAGNLVCPIVADGDARRFLIEEDINEVPRRGMQILRPWPSGARTFRYDVTALPATVFADNDRKIGAPLVQGGGQSPSPHNEWGVKAEYVVCSRYLRSETLDRIGRILKNCIAYGPGILDFAHKPDELVGVDDCWILCEGDGAVL